MIKKSNDQFKIDIITKVVAGIIMHKTAAQLLNKNRNTITRYVREYKKKGALFVLHKSLGHPGRNKTPEETKEKILKLISEKYYDFNVSHAYEKLAEEELQVISYRTLLRWYHEKKFIKTIRRKRRKAHNARERMPQRGLLLQMDGSFHNWFGNKKTSLIAAIDDADSDVPYAEFFNSETTLNCMKVMQKIIEIKGIPKVLYVDRAGIFGGSKRMEFSHFEESCKELGIQIIFAYSPQAKGRIERLWKTLQGRIIPEMRLKNITTMEEANRYLQNIYLPDIYRAKFTVPPISKDIEYTPIPANKDLNEIFVIKYTRIIINNNTFSYDAQRYQINSPFSFSGMVVEIRIYQDSTVKFYFKNRLLDNFSLIESKSQKVA